MLPSFGFIRLLIKRIQKRRDFYRINPQNEGVTKTSKINTTTSTIFLEDKSQELINLSSEDWMFWSLSTASKRSPVFLYFFVLFVGRPVRRSLSNRSFILGTSSSSIQRNIYKKKRRKIWCTQGTVIYQLLINSSLHWAPANIKKNY